MVCVAPRYVWFAVLVLAFSGDALAFRCGHKLVQIGDYQSEILEKCGDPDAVQERRAIRGSRLRHPYGALELNQFEEVMIEEWIYNFGSRKFQQLLEFEDGELKNIRRLGYGY